MIRGARSGIVAFAVDADTPGIRIGRTVEMAAGRGSDHAEVIFDNGFTASFQASRVAPERERTMKVVYPSGEVSINFLTREFSNTTPFALNAAFTETPAGKDPLGASVQAFLDAVRGVAPRPLVTGRPSFRGAWHDKETGRHLG